MPEKSNRRPAREFEELHVYRQARALVNRIYALTGTPRFARDYGLKDQLRRGTGSILSNIAEGFERGSNRAFVQALRIAKGSCGEVRAQVTVAFDQKYLGPAEFEEIIQECRRLSASLARLVAYLKKSQEGKLGA